MNSNLITTFQSEYLKIVFYNFVKYINYSVQVFIGVSHAGLPKYSAV